MLQVEELTKENESLRQTVKRLKTQLDMVLTGSNRADNNPLNPGKKDTLPVTHNIYEQPIPQRRQNGQLTGPNYHLNRYPEGGHQDYAPSRYPNDVHEYHLQSNRPYPMSDGNISPDEYNNDNDSIYRGAYWRQ